MQLYISRYLLSRILKYIIPSAPYQNIFSSSNATHCIHYMEHAPDENVVNLQNENPILVSLVSAQPQPLHDLVFYLHQFIKIREEVEAKKYSDTLVS